MKHLYAMLARPRMMFICLLLAQFWTFSGCGMVEPGSSGLSPLSRLPDPGMYALQVHPVLSESCGTTNCHGQPGPLMIIPSSSGFEPDTKVLDPRDLSEPFRSSYYSVIQHSDLKQAESSSLVLWGTGTQTDHPGGNALDDQDLELVLKWLRSGGAR